MTEFQNAAPDPAHLLKCELAREVLRSSGTLRLRVTGWSMLPTVMPGDTLIVDRAGGGVSRGDIVLFARDQLEAAVHPEPADYLYFVSDNNGGHIFAKTLAQHQNAVREYRRALALDAAIAPQTPSSPEVTTKPRRPRTRK